MRHRPSRPGLGPVELIADEGHGRDDQPGLRGEPRGGPGGGQLRDARLDLGQRGVQGGAGLVNLVAELGGLGVRGSGSFNRIEPDQLARRGHLSTARYNPRSLTTPGREGQWRGALSSLSPPELARTLLLPKNM